MHQFKVQMYKRKNSVLNTISKQQHILNKILSETHAICLIYKQFWISDENLTSINETALYQLKTTMCRPGVICEFLRVKACIMALLCLLFHTFPQLSVME